MKYYVIMLLFDSDSLKPDGTLHCFNCFYLFGLEDFLSLLYHKICVSVSQIRQRSVFEVLAMSKFWRERIGNWKRERGISLRGTTPRLSLSPLVKSKTFFFL